MALTGDPVVATGTNSDTQNTSGTTTSAVFTATLSGGTACGQAFVAPPSGQVAVLHSCFVSPSAGVNGFATIRVRTGGVVGAGVDVVVALDSNAIIPPPGTAFVRGCAHTVVAGLTAGSTYNVQEMFRQDAAGTLTVRDKHLSVIGLP